jgi:hypothetical protein
VITTAPPTPTTEDALRGACEAAARSGAQKDLIEECLASGHITAIWFW